MPSKGHEESDRSRKAKTTKLDKPARQSVGREGGAGQEGLAGLPGPWTFEIVRPTPAAFLCRKADPVIGSRSRREIGVSQAQRGVIGFAPPQAGAEMLEALRRHRGASLSGKVVTAGDRQKEMNPVVTLALEPGS